MLFFTLLTVTIKEAHFPHTLNMFLIRAFVAENHSKHENVKVAINWFFCRMIKCILILFHVFLGDEFQLLLLPLQYHQKHLMTHV